MVVTSIAGALGFVVGRDQRELRSMAPAWPGAVLCATPVLSANRALLAPLTEAGVEIRWNERGRTPDAREDLANYDVLVLTERVPVRSAMQWHRTKELSLDWFLLFVHPLVEAELKKHRKV